MKAKLFLILAPYILYFSGAVLNRVAINVNEGLMPVHINPKTWEQPIYPGERIDHDHIAWSNDVRWGFICDWIEMPYGNVVSIGDLMVDTAEDIKLPFLAAWLILESLSSRKKGSTDYGREYVSEGCTSLPRSRNRQSY